MSLWGLYHSWVLGLRSTGVSQGQQMSSGSHWEQQFLPDYRTCTADVSMRVF